MTAWQLTGDLPPWIEAEIAEDEWLTHCEEQGIDPDDDEPDWAAVAEDRRIAAETDARWEGP